MTTYFVAGRSVTSNDSEFVRWESPLDAPTIKTGFWLAKQHVRETMEFPTFTVVDEGAMSVTFLAEGTLDDDPVKELIMIWDEALEA